MLREAVSAGVYEPDQRRGQLFPRVQILTIGDLLAGREADYPRFGTAGKPALF